MIFPTVFCFVLVLTFTSAENAKKDEVDKLANQISTEAANEMAKVVKESHKDPKASTLGLHNQLLETLRDQLEKMESQIKKLGELTENSKELISKSLSAKINENEALRKALDVATDSKQKPRFLGALVIGITQVVTDVTNMVLRRY